MFSAREWPRDAKCMSAARWIIAPSAKRPLAPLERSPQASRLHAREEILFHAIVHQPRQYWPSCIGRRPLDGWRARVCKLNTRRSVMAKPLSKMAPLSSQPHLHLHGREIQEFGTVRLFPLGLSHDARAYSCQRLNQILADTQILYAL